MFRSSAVGSLLFAYLAATAAAQEDHTGLPTIEHGLEYLGFDGDDLAALRDGAILSKKFRETHDKQLSATFVMAVRWPLHQVAALIREGRTMEIDRHISMFSILGDRAPTEEDFASVGFSAAERNEIRDLYNAEAGSKFNLGFAGIARFQAVRDQFPVRHCDRDPACARAVVEAYRQVLLQRAGAYWASGLAGITPYARGGRGASPAEELRAAAADARLVSSHFPEFYRAFMRFPRAPDDEIENQLLWIKQRTQGRPTYVLAHRVFYSRPDGFLMAERQFFVGHTYNSLQIFLACVPDGDRTIVFYTNRTSTDLVAGFAAGMRHSIGRKKMMEQIRLDLKETLSTP